jgi:hypothetical protein
MGFVLMAAAAAQFQKKLHSIEPMFLDCKLAFSSEFMSPCSYSPRLVSRDPPPPGFWKLNVPQVIWVKQRSAGSIIVDSLDGRISGFSAIILLEIIKNISKYLYFIFYIEKTQLT